MQESKTTTRVFLSYSHDDAAAAEKLRARLGLIPEVRTLLDGGISSGSNWAVKIRKALKESDVVIVLASPESLSSDRVLTEWGAAWGLEKHILVILLEENPLLASRALLPMFPV